MVFEPTGQFARNGEGRWISLRGNGRSHGDQRDSQHGKTETTEEPAAVAEDPFSQDFGSTWDSVDTKVPGRSEGNALPVAL